MAVSTRSQVVIIKSESDASAKAEIARIALKKQHGRKSHESVRALLLPVFASVWSIELVTGEGSGSGKQVLDSSASGYEACRKALGRTVTFICGARESNAVEVPPKLVKKISNEIIEAGLTKKQFDALLTQLRASVSFQ
jgi:uncharacterized protein Veg